MLPLSDRTPASMTTTNTQTAMEFVSRFAAGDVDGLGSLLAEPFHLKGPLFEFHSKQAYLDSLAGDVEEAVSRIVAITDDGERVLVVYEYRKRDTTITISQLLTFIDGKVADTLLAFDTQGFG